MVLDDVSHLLVDLAGAGNRQQCLVQAVPIVALRGLQAVDGGQGKGVDAAAAWTDQAFQRLDHGVARQSRPRLNRPFHHFDRQDLAGTDRPPIEQHGAATAVAVRTCVEQAARVFDLLQQVIQRPVRWNCARDRSVVERKMDGVMQHRAEIITADTSNVQQQNLPAKCKRDSLSFLGFPARIKKRFEAVLWACQ